ncbi:MAG: DUF4345 family protein [Alphaproteobacteria bacterium]
MITRLILRIAVILLGVGFLYVGSMGFFRPERLAVVLDFNPETLVGLGSVRALVGAQYLAMGLTAIVAAVRGHWSWLAPLAAIEGCMVLARILSGFEGEWSPNGMTTLIMEVVSCLLLGLGAVLPNRLSQQPRSAA